MEKAAQHRQRRTVLATGLIASVLLVAGCSSSGGSDAGPSATAGTTPAAGQPATPQLDASLQAKLPAAVRSAGEISIGTNTPYAPFESFKSAGSKEFVGLDIDLGNAIAAVLGVKANFKQQPYDGLIPGLQAGKYDMLMAGISSDASRMKTVDFADYARTGPGMLVKKDNPLGIKSFLDLCGKKIAVEKGDDQAANLPQRSSKCTAAGKPAITVLSYPSYPDGQLALTSGKVDGVASGIATVVSTVTQPGGAAFSAVEDPDILGGGVTDQHNLGVVFTKSNTALRDAVQGALQDIMNTGYYTKLMTQYDLQEWQVPKATVNGAVVEGVPTVSSTS